MYLRSTYIYVVACRLNPSAKRPGRLSAQLMRTGEYIKGHSLITQSILSIDLYLWLTRPPDVPLFDSVDGRDNKNKNKPLSAVYCCAGFEPNRCVFKDIAVLNKRIITPHGYPSPRRRMKPFKRVVEQTSGRKRHDSDSRAALTTHPCYISLVFVLAAGLITRCCGSVY